jgi:hypothetical protein
LNETHAGAGSIFTQLRVTIVILVIVFTAAVVVMRGVGGALSLLQAFDASRHSSTSLAKLSKAEALIKSESRTPASPASSASSRLYSLVVGRRVSYITTHRAHVCMARGVLHRQPAATELLIFVFFLVLARVCCSVVFVIVCPYAFHLGCHTPPAHNL